MKYCTQVEIMDVLTVRQYTKGNEINHNFKYQTLILSANYGVLISVYQTHTLYSNHAIMACIVSNKDDVCLD